MFQSSGVVLYFTIYIVYWLDQQILVSASFCRYMVEEWIERFKKYLLDNKNKMAVEIEPSLSSPGRIIWCNSDGDFLTCIAVKNNKQYGKWYELSDFDEIQAEYDPNSNQIKYGNGRSLKIKQENESYFIKKTSNQKDLSNIVRLKTTVVGRIYLNHIY